MSDAPASIDPGPTPDAALARRRRFRPGWEDHPAVRSGDELTRGERAADLMRNGMGSWPFVGAALLFLAAWMLYNGDTGFDKYPFILLNLVLSCLAALQGAILLIAAKRQDQIASQLAQHDYATNVEAEQEIRAVHQRIVQLEERIVGLVSDNRELLRQNSVLLERAVGSQAPPDAPG